MFEAWRWRYSREAELAALVACVIGNRIPMNDKAVEYEVLLRSLGLYSEN